MRQRRVASPLGEAELADPELAFRLGVVHRLILGGRRILDIEQLVHTGLREAACAHAGRL
jgi:hypothetical protein